MTKKYTYEFKIQFRDIDYYGHVNHATYLSYFEQARVQLLVDMGCPIESFLQEGIQLVIVNINISYKYPTLLKDSLIIHSGVAQVKNSSMIIRQEAYIKDSGRLAASGELRFAFVKDGKPVRIPKVMSAAFSG